MTGGAMAVLAQAAMLHAMALQPDVIPPGAIEIAESFFAMIAVISLGVPLIRAFTKRWERRPLPSTQGTPDVIDRLERIEQAVEAVAIEVERIAEAQRFAAKLMAEQPRVLPRSETGS